MPAMSTVRARIGFGEVRHRRLAPVEHAFTYPTCFLMLPMRSLQHEADPVLARNRPAMFGFRDSDHGDGRADSLAWLDELLAGEGIHDASGEVWLHCIPRMFGFAFKPVSFWYAHRPDSTLSAIVVEVNNTFGERHCYLLAGTDLDFGRTLAATKVFHVSPFCQTRGEYAFRFMRTDLAARDGRGRTAVRVELHVDGAPLVLTSVSGRIEPLTAAAVRFALWTLPAMTAVIVARIHWHALKLWMKKIPFVAKPAPPGEVSRGGMAMKPGSDPISRSGATAPMQATSGLPPTPDDLAPAHNLT